MSWLWLGLSILCEVTATLSLRAASTSTNRFWLAPIVLGYVSAFAFLAKTLDAGMPVGVAYGIWTSIGIVVVALMGHAIWKDPLNRRMAAGIGLVVAGIALVELGLFGTFTIHVPRRAPRRCRVGMGATCNHALPAYFGYVRNL